MRTRRHARTPCIWRSAPSSHGPQGRHRARATGDHRQGRPRRHAQPSRHRGQAANRKPAGCSHGGQDPPTARRLQRCQLHRRGRRRRPPSHKYGAARLQVLDQERGRRVPGIHEFDEPRQGPHGKLVLLEGCGVGRRHPLQQRHRDGAVRIPRKRPAVQQAVQRQHEGSLHHPHEEATPSLLRL
ncbi:unnamed protein product [Musa acuminata subsp. burmannicoides]